MTRHTLARQPMRSRRAFSLLEVLISILILAFGLLGVLAAFPSVIEIQRRAQDDIVGAAAAGAAEAYIRSAIWDNESQRIENDNDPATIDPSSPRDLLRFDASLGSFDFNASTGETIFDYEWQWQAFWPGRDNTLNATSFGATGPTNIHNNNFNASRIFNRGSLVIGGGPDARSLPDAAFDSLDILEVPVAARLFPAPGSGAVPQYVWDVVFRRVDIGLEQDSSSTPGLSVVLANDIDDMPLQAAIFVRRIDPGIAVIPEVAGDDSFTVAEAVAGIFIETTGSGAEPAGTPIPDTLRRVPVTAVEAGSVGGIFQRYPTQPTNDGRVGANQGYAVILGIGITVDPEGDGSYDIVEFSDPGGSLAAAALRRQAGQPRQVLVDNGGGIRTVVEVLDANDDGGAAFDGGAPVRVRVEPSYSPGDALAGGLSQAVFTPQIPVAVRVIELLP